MIFSRVFLKNNFHYSRSESFVRDADLHGTSYAKWKRQMVKKMEDENNEAGDYYEDDDINEVDEF